MTMRCSVLQCVLQCVALCCSVLQCGSVCVAVYNVQCCEFCLAATRVKWY